MGSRFTSLSAQAYNQAIKDMHSDPEIKGGASIAKLRIKDVKAVLEHIDNEVEGAEALEIEEAVTAHPIEKERE